MTDVLREAADATEKALAAYIEEYEYDDGEGQPHFPNEWERDLINDAIRGLLSDDDFIRTFTAWRDAAKQ